METTIVGLDDGAGAPVIVGADELVGRIVRRMGGRMQSKVTPHGVLFRASLPRYTQHQSRKPRELTITHLERFPVEVSGKFGRKLVKASKKAVKVVKKIAKNKVVQALGKVAMQAAQVVPGMQAVAMGGQALSVVAKAAKGIKAAKKAVKLGKGASKLVKAAAGLKGASVAARAKASPAAEGGRVVTVASGRRFRVVPL